PAFERRPHPELLRALDRAIEGDPRHHLRVREVLPSAAHFPDALVRLIPDAFEMIDECPRHLPGFGARVETSLPRVIQRVHQLTEHIQLELAMCRIADAYGRRLLVAREPGHFPLGEAALAP